MRPLLRLAVPVFVEEILNMLVGYTDWWLAGRFLAGDDYRAAMGLMAYSMWLIPCLFSAVAIGAIALIARFVGQGDGNAARRVVGQAFIIGAAVALASTLLVWFTAPTFASAMQLEERAAELAVRYLTIIVPVIPLIMLEQVGIACLRGAGDTVTGLYVKVLVNVVNTVLSTCLLLGLGFFPRLGWEGIAIGTACGHGLAGVIVLVLLCRGRAGLQLRWLHLRPDWPLMQRLVRVGLPGGLDVISVIACHLCYVSIINRLGTLAAAAHGLGVQIEALAYLPGSAFQVAAATMAGQWLGAGLPQRAKHSSLTALGIGMAVMCCSGVVLFFFGGQIAGFFTGDVHDPTAEIVGQLLPIVAIAMPCFAVVSILSGALRGAGDTRFPLAITFIGLIGIRIPGAAYLAWEHVDIAWLGITIAGWNLGVQGAWYAMVIDVAVRSVLVAARFFSGRWQHLRV